MARTPGTHCKRGHEIAVVGRYASGQCRACMGVDVSKPYRRYNARAKFCKRGHAQEGNRIVRKSGREAGCRTCHAEREAARRGGVAMTPKTVRRRRAEPGRTLISAVPILEFLKRSGISIKSMGPRYAEITGMKPATGARLMWRVQASGRISVDAADTVCIALGRHPAEVFGPEWFTYGAKEVASAV